MLDAVLGAAGYQSSLFTSPHLVDFTERIRVGGGRSRARRWSARRRSTRRSSARESLTHFEFATLLAFGVRRGRDRRGRDRGRPGGQLDATNPSTRSTTID
jgi:dihydrofolate synthase/folylpolyglutamate synthase